MITLDSVVTDTQLKPEIKTVRTRRPSVQKKIDVDLSSAATESAVAVEAPLLKPETKSVRTRRPSVQKKIDAVDPLAQSNANVDSSDVMISEPKKRGRKPKAASAITAEDKENEDDKKQLIKTAGAKVTIEHW